MKIDVHMLFCSILSQQLVSMKMMLGFVMYVLYWFYQYAHCSFLGMFVLEQSFDVEILWFDS